MPAKVLFYVLCLEEGGTEKRLERLARGLDRDRFDPCVAYTERWGPVGDRLQAAGVPVVQMPLGDPARMESAIRVIRRLAPDLFHSCSHKHPRDVIAARSAGVPAIITSRVNMREWDPGMRVQAWERVRNRHTNCITAVSQAVAKLCETVEGVPPQKIAVVHNGVTLPAPSSLVGTIRAELGLGAGVDVLGYVANYRPEKAHEILLQSFRLVLDRRPKTHLVCCGIMTPERRAQLIQLVRDLNLRAHVTLLDTRSDVEAIYRSLDIYVHPSRLEGFSNSILEAMAHGLPVVATAAGGTPEAVADGRTGLLVPVDDVPALAEALVALLCNPDRRRTFGTAGRNRIELHFSVQAMIRGYEAVFSDLVSRNSAGGDYFCAAG